MKRNLFYSILLIDLIAIFYIWWTGSSSLVSSGSGYYVAIAFGRLAGLLAQTVILLQLILIGRLTFIEQEFGHDKMNRLHRILGYSILGLLIFHPVLLIIGYAGIANIGLWQQLVTFFTSSDDIANAIIGFLLLCLIVTFAIPWVRRKLKYEYWYWTHLTIYIVIGLVFSHQLDGEDLARPTATTYWLALNIIVWIVYFYFRFARAFLKMWKHKFYVEKIVSEPGDVHSIYIRGEKMDEFTHTEGQFAHWTFFARKFWYTHPFSISHEYTGEFLRLSVKNSGDFTSTIKNIPIGTRVMIDGPLGTFTEKSAIKGKYLFIAGGIGITPIRAMIGSLAKKNADMILLYGNRTLSETVFREELASRISRMHIILSADNQPGYESGFIDKEKIARLAPDFLERDIFLCGPPVMMDKVIATLLDMGVPHDQIHYEKFSY